VEWLSVAIKKSTIYVCFIKVSVPTSYETLCPFLLKKNSLLIFGETFRFIVGIVVTRYVYINSVHIKQRYLRNNLAL